MAHYCVWDVAPRSAIIRIKPQDGANVTGRLSWLPSLREVRSNLGGGGAQGFVFELSAKDVQLLLSRPGLSGPPILAFEAYASKSEGSPPESGWGFAVKVEQGGQEVPGAFPDGRPVLLDRDGFKRIDMRPFLPGTAFAGTSLHLGFATGAIR